jgi:glycosyltransferase involved in cell wall biosynthesis
MKILFYSQYFYPETNAPANRWTYFAEYLSKKGHEITVLTSFPNHPLGKIFKGYKNCWRFIEKKEEIEIIHTWTYVSSSRKFLSRLLNYFSFAFSSYFNSRYLKNKNFDCFIASSPPLSVPIIGKMIAKKFKIPFILDLRDVWPEAAISTGYLKKGFLYNLAEKWERKVYQEAKKIIVNSPAILEELNQNKDVPLKKLEYIPNGADLEFFCSDRNYEEIERKYGLKNKFVVLYTGLLGFAQAPEFLVDTAKILAENKEIVFLIVGEGPLKKDLELKIKKLGLKNIILTGQRLREEMPLFVARGDICLVPYKNKTTFKKNIPSKMFDYMAAGKPIIINLKGVASNIIEQASAGLLVEPENSQSLAENILKIYHNESLREKMGSAAKIYAENNYNKKVISEKLEIILKNVTK